MKRSAIIWTVVVVVLVVGAGIWYWSSNNNAMMAGTQQATSTVGGNTGTTGAPAGTATTPSSTMPSTVVLNTETTSTLGTYLTATNGMTLYLSKGDQARVSNCTGACAVAWPPYTVSSSVATSLLGSTPGITGSIGVLKRADGTYQVTYNNLPLYFYAKDKAVGDDKGQNVGGFVIVNL